jgi:uncharacterized membrane protein YeaQ/YmgE (transglycosylase-associated protein family)
MLIPDPVLAATVTIDPELANIIVGAVGAVLGWLLRHFTGKRS